MLGDEGAVFEPFILAARAVIGRKRGLRKLYRLRNMVDRCFNKVMNALRGATRYDKTAESVFGLIHITSIRHWLRHLTT
jgi:transposase